MGRSKPKSEPKKTVRVRLAATARFSRVLDSMRSHYEHAKDKEWLVIPYIVTCAAALEARLNDELVEYAHRKWQCNEPTFAQSLLTMSLRGKLNTLVPLLTEHRFQFNRSHFVYQRLNSLISVRNLLVHPKPVYKDLPVAGDPHPFGFQIPEEYFELVEDVTLG